MTPTGLAPARDEGVHAREGDREAVPRRQTSSRPSRVLVVDDTESNLELICLFLAQEPYEVLRARSGEEALETIERECPDLVLLDVVMPGMGGMETVRQLRRREETQLLPVVMLTGFSPTADHQIQGLDAGADDFLFKPINRAQLLAKVRTLLRVKQAQDERDEHARLVERLYGELSRKNTLLESFSERVRNDLVMARRIQRALLPQARLELDGLLLEALYRPCDELGGDFFDYSVIRPELLNLVLVDVSGHGLPAAIVVSLIKSLCYRELQDDFEPAQFLQQLNDLLLHALSEGHFATACCFQFDVRRREMRFCNGGHPPFLILRRESGKVEEVRQPGALLGLFEHARFGPVTFRLGAGDRVLFYTDGVVDRRSTCLETFDLERLKRALKAGAALPLGEALRGIEGELDRFGRGEPTIDDAALIGVEVR